MRMEDSIGSGPREEEMNSPQLLIHHAPEHFWEPVVRSGEHPEDGRHTHDQVEVPDHERGVMQRNVEYRLREKWSAQPARDEQRNESDSIEHRGLETNSSTTDRPQPVESLDRGRDADSHGHDGKCERRIRTHAAHEHVVPPDHETEEPNAHDGVHHRLVTEDWLAGEGGDQL